MNTSRDVHRERMAWLADLAAAAPMGECVDWPWKVNPDGYPQPMNKAGRRGLRPVHLLLEMVGRPRPGHTSEVLHSCDRPVCMAPWHVRWGTHRENVADMVAKGRQRTHKSTLTIDSARSIRAAVSGGSSQRAVARQYGVHHSVVQQIVRNEIWKELQTA
jgi:hypothetical protein